MADITEHEAAEISEADGPLLVVAGEKGTALGSALRFVQP